MSGLKNRFILHAAISANKEERGRGSEPRCDFASAAVDMSTRHAPNAKLQGADFVSLALDIRGNAARYRMKRSFELATVKVREISHSNSQRRMS